MTEALAPGMKFGPIEAGAPCGGLTGSVVRAAGSATLNLGTAMTLSAWVRPAASQSGWRTILQRQTDFLTVSCDSPMSPAGGGTLGGGVNYVIVPAANPVNTWTHVALTYDGATLRPYLNGTQAAYF